MAMLGFGSHVIIDGYQADSALLGDEVHVVKVTETLARDVNASQSEQAPYIHVYSSDQGVSAALIHGDIQITLHTFAHKQSLSLGMFACQDLDGQHLQQVLAQHFAVGRIESHKGNRACLLPRNEATLHVQLVGIRGYTDVRMEAHTVHNFV